MFDVTYKLTSRQVSKPQDLRRRRRVFDPRDVNPLVTTQKGERIHYSYLAVPQREIPCVRTYLRAIWSLPRKPSRSGRGRVGSEQNGRNGSGQDRGYSQLVKVRQPGR